MANGNQMDSQEKVKLKDRKLLSRQGTKKKKRTVTKMTGTQVRK